MKVTSNKKPGFTQLNNKKFIFSEGVLSLLMGHLCFKNLRIYKKDSQEKNEDLIMENKTYMPKMEHECLLSVERLEILKAILLQSFNCYRIDGFRVIVAILLEGANSGQTSIKCLDLAYDVELLPL